MEFKKRNSSGLVPVSAGALRRHGLGKHAAGILLARGIKEEDLDAFLHPETQPVPDGNLLGGTDEIRNLLHSLKEHGEGICICAPRTVDATISMVILTSLFQREQIKVCCRLLEKNWQSTDDGSQDAAYLRLLKARGKASAVLFAGYDDSFFPLLEAAQRLGLRTAVLSVLQPAISPLTLGPCLSAGSLDSRFPEKNISCGVTAYLFARTLNETWADQVFLDLVFLSVTLSGMPLSGIGRILFARSKDFFLRSVRPFFRYVMERARIPGCLPPLSVVYTRFRPLLESALAGKDSQKAATALFTANKQLAQAALETMDQALCRQEDTVRSVYEAQLKDPYSPFQSVDSSWSWEQMKILAEKLSGSLESDLLLVNAGKLQGLLWFCTREDALRFAQSSGLQNLRPVPGGNGHYAFSCSEQEASKLSEAFFQHLKQTEARAARNKVYDLEMRMSELDETLAQELSPLAPFGPGNPAPVILVRDVSLKNVCRSGRNAENFSFDLYDEGGSMHGSAYSLEPPRHHIGLDALVSLSADSLTPSLSKGTRLILKALRRSDSHRERDLRNARTRYTQSDSKLDHPIRVLHLPAEKQAQLEKKGLTTIRSLLEFYPRRYMDFRKQTPLRAIAGDEPVRVDGRIVYVTKKPDGSQVCALCTDEDGREYRVYWFHQSYVYDRLAAGMALTVCGRFKFSRSGPPMVTPVSWSCKPGQLSRIVPVYSKISGMSDAYLENTIMKALEYVDNYDYLEEDILSRYHLPSQYDTYWFLHRPRSDLDLQDGSHRTRFDIFFENAMLLQAAQSKGELSSEFFFPFTSCRKWKELKALLPYTLTADQEKSIRHMYETVYMDEKRLNALVQGDVGSGKTIVALFMMTAAAEAGLQSVLAVPTEVLARQHFAQFEQYASDLGFKCALLTGAMKASEKKRIKKEMESGAVDMIIGTHALFSSDVHFSRLGLVVIDEQHKFGVRQREILADSKTPPHVINMSATPIPRTVAMSLLGSDLQVENIHTRPSGRKDVITRIVESDDEVNDMILQEVRKGRQAYIVCPHIDESEAESMQGVSAVNSVFEDLKFAFRDEPEVCIESISGNMKPRAVSEVISRFESGITNVLISTTIVEVGVNVPNATLMVLKNSERFGLAQAHQLRGRVGRGNEQAYCLLQTRPDDPKANILVSSTDGFEIARQDLELRGTGSLVGNRQSGNNINTRLILEHAEEFEKVRREAGAIFSSPDRLHLYSPFLARAALNTAA